MSAAASATPPAPLPVGRMVVAGLAFLVSGASALVYQVAWQRILALHSGVGLYSVAVIVASFMAGLGLGSYLGGHLSTRGGPRGALWAFAALELGIAAFGASSAHLYYDWLYPKAVGLHGSAVGTAVLHLASLLPPTLLMGMSLPFLVRALLRDPGRAGSTIGYLYGINVLGASLGALLTPWLLVPSFGIRGALLAAAAGNLLAALAAVALLRTDKGPSSGPALEPAPARTQAHPFALWLALYALSGFCALSLEILWFRMVEVAVKATAFTFGSVLFVYLLGSALGSLAGTRLERRVDRPLRAFLLCQCLLLLYAGAAALLVVHVPPSLPGFRWLYAYWGESAPLSPRVGLSTFALVHFLTPTLLFGLPTVLMGFSFPVLQRAVHDDLVTSGRKVGFLQAANIAGCLAGSLLAGLALLEWVGTAHTLRVVVALGLVFAAAGFKLGQGRAFIALGAALAAVALAMPGPLPLWLRLHATGAAEVILQEDATGVIMARRDLPRRWSFWVQGKRNSSFPYGGLHTALGAIPAIVHPHPDRVAVIGLGSGDTAWAAGCRTETTHLKVFEIVAPQLGVLRTFAPHPEAPRELRRLLKDPRVDIEVADGRRALAQGGRDWDLVEMDALYPDTAYSGNLNSEEFLALCARRLRPSGILCAWAPTPRIYSTFASVFPYVLEFSGGALLVGSMSPIALDPKAWRARLFDGSTAEYLGAYYRDMVWQYLATARPGRPPVRRPNQDLFPRDEFLVAEP